MDSIPREKLKPEYQIEGIQDGSPFLIFYETKEGIVNAIGSYNFGSDSSLTKGLSEGIGMVYNGISLWKESGGTKKEIQDIIEHSESPLVNFTEIKESLDQLLLEEAPVASSTE